MCLGDNEDYIFMGMSALVNNRVVSDHDIGHHARATRMRHTGPIWCPSIRLLLLLVVLLFLIKVHFWFRLTPGIVTFLFGRPPFVKAILIHVGHSRQRTRRVERSMTAPGWVISVDI